MEVIENNKKYLERKEFYKSFGYDIEAERKFILEKARPISGNILEIGTGKGHFALALAQEGFKFTSVDISQEEQKIARLNLEHFGLENQVNLKVENAEQLSFADKSFDIIFSIHAVHHFANPLKVIDEMVRIVAAGGKIILSDFNSEGLKMIEKAHAEEGRKHHSGKTKLTQLEKYLLSKNFNTERHSSKFQEVLIAHNSNR